MKSLILCKLKEIEQHHDIKIWFACESGSRGWGIPSPDSDYDVRFIYTKSWDGYMSIETQKDQLSFPITCDLDIYGWDLRKVLRLIRKSNTTPFEWLQSPEVYRQNEAFSGELWALCQSYFSRKANMFHYLGIAKTAWKELDDDGYIKIKVLFYVLRPLLAACWCMQRGAIAPMDMPALLEMLPGSLKPEVAELLKFKTGAKESECIFVTPALREYINYTWTYCNSALEEMELEQFQSAELELFFRNTITKK